MMTELTAISLFDGIGGFPRAFLQAGIRTVAAVEIDKAAAGVAADHFPDMVQFGDIRKVTGAQLLAAGFDPRRGLISAGFPCQDLSLAGRRAGLDGARSGLFFEIMRILDELFALTGVRCRWVVLENVPGLLSSVCPCPGGGACGGRDVVERIDDEDGFKIGERRRHIDCTDSHTVRGGACGPGKCIEIHGGAMGAVLGELAERGYGFAYRVLDAQHFGVPQRRRRVVIVGCAGDRAAPAQVLLEPESGAGDPAQGGPAGTRIARVLALSARGTGGSDGFTGRRVVSSLTTSSVGGLGGADDNSAQGGHLIAASTVALPSVLAHHGRNNPGQDALITDYMGGGPEVFQGQGTNVGPMGTLRAGSASASGGIPFTVGDGGPDDDETSRSASLVPMGFSEHGFGDSSRDDSSPSLRTGSGGAATMTATGAAVRRLTPVECERLQGYPDGWTATSNSRSQDDSPRYRQLGNSVAVPVFTWVAMGIADYERGVK
jgi:DNA (cytosine-5)-methyltransferase 1